MTAQSTQPAAVVNTNATVTVGKKIHHAKIFSLSEIDLRATHTQTVDTIKKTYSDSKHIKRSLGQIAELFKKLLMQFAPPRAH